MAHGLRGLTHLSLRKNVISEEHFEIFLLQLFGQGSERPLMEHLLSEPSPRERPPARGVCREREDAAGAEGAGREGATLQDVLEGGLWNSSDGTGWRALRAFRPATGCALRSRAL